MPVDIDIIDEDIANAELVLLPAGKIFDSERRTFIKCLDTLDLHAVPGSGKTTALLAKLLALERYLPFKDGSGILVISHTNAAVDEIKRRLGNHCQKLFSYPNFVGTIQVFVDQFLAIPYYVQALKYRPARIDNETYSARAKRFNNVHLKDYSRQEKNNAMNYLHCYENVDKFRFALINGKRALVSRINGTPLKIKKPRSIIDWNEDEKNRIIDWLTEFKKIIMHEGCLCFDDAYYLANCLLSKIPKVKDVLQKRFSYVFVDEMQDMGKHQYDLLEHLFFDGGKSCSFYQRIGDRNQGIHNPNDFDVESIWKERPVVLHLTNSCRLSPPIARVIEPFAVHDPSMCHLNGLGEAGIRPHMIVFSDSSRKQVLRQFAKLLKKLIGQGRLPAGNETIFKAVAWNAEWPDREGKKENNIRLTDYYTFRKVRQQPLKDYGCIRDYITISNFMIPPFREASSRIFNLFLKVLRMEHIKNPLNNSHFTAGSLRRYLRENHVLFYEDFLLQIYRWTLASVKQETTNTENEIKIAIPNLLRIFGCIENNSKDFITSTKEVTPQQSKLENLSTNTYVFDEISIELATVHAVKGQTHTATLYLESYYQQDGHGQDAKSYESQRLAPQFMGCYLNGSEGKRVKQSAKIAYVGFSRPTHLLCFAVHQDRFNKCLSRIDRSVWEIILIDDKEVEL